MNSFAKLERFVNYIPCFRSKFQKKCKIHERNTKFKTRFEFKCDSKELTVEPRRGCVQYNQVGGINL